MHEGAAELFDVDCTSQVRKQHVDAVNRLLPPGVELVDAKPLMQGAPSLGKMICASRYRIGPRPGLRWPEEPTQLDESIAGAVHRWTVLADGSLSVDLNTRQDLGPTTNVKQLLAALGFSPTEISCDSVNRCRFNGIVAEVILPKVETVSVMSVSGTPV